MKVNKNRKVFHLKLVAGWMTEKFSVWQIEKKSQIGFTDKNETNFLL